MQQKLCALILSTAALSGCVSHEGTYVPDCIAYAGSKITLTDGDFVWEKFTDEVVVNNQGEVVNQFPGYPMRGTYRINGQIVLMRAADGEPMDNMYLHRHDEQTYLYTAEQFRVWETSGKVPNCALVQK